MDEHAADRAVGALIGLAVGDAIGTTVEFSVRDQFPPLEDMIGGGPFRLKPGQWTDDTSMALCLADSLNAYPDFDPEDLMRRFVRWWQDGENSVLGVCFDIGLATRSALHRFVDSGDPFSGDPSTEAAGNGSLMRLAPVSIAHHGDTETAVRLAIEQSRTTHAAPQCLDACALFARMLVLAIAGADKETVLTQAKLAEDIDLYGIKAMRWRDKPRSEISSSGYVVHTLEAALWAVDQSSSFEEAVLLAANLGDDADTVAAVTGQLAGALWGFSSIPRAWIDKLAWSKSIEERARGLFLRQSVA